MLLLIIIAILLECKQSPARLMILSSLFVLIYNTIRSGRRLRINAPAVSNVLIVLTVSKIYHRQLHQLLRGGEREREVITRIILDRIRGGGLVKLLGVQHKLLLRLQWHLHPESIHAQLKIETNNTCLRG